MTDSGSAPSGTRTNNELFASLHEWLAGTEGAHELAELQRQTVGMADWLLPCGCVLELEPIGGRMAAAIVGRCDEHPTGNVPIPSVALFDAALSIPSTPG